MAAVSGIFFPPSSRTQFFGSSAESYRSSTAKNFLAVFAHPHTLYIYAYTCGCIPPIMYLRTPCQARTLKSWQTAAMRRAQMRHCKRSEKSTEPEAQDTAMRQIRLRVNVATELISRQGRAARELRAERTQSPRPFGLNTGVIKRVLQHRVVCGCRNEGK